MNIPFSVWVQAIAIIAFIMVLFFAGYGIGYEKGYSDARKNKITKRTKPNHSTSYRSLTPPPQEK